MILETNLLLLMGNLMIIQNSTAIIIYQQASYINFKIENNSLVVTKTY